MNESRSRSRNAGDAIAIAIQQLQVEGKADGEQPLVRLDYRREAARAPLQFDPAQGKMHRTGCRAIPASSRPALYAVWDFHPRDQQFACPRCRPMTPPQKELEPAEVVDLAYGVLSLVDQFRTILFERGREYRQSLQGRNLEGPLAGLLGSLGAGQGQTTAIAAAMDTLLRALNSASQNLNGKPQGNGGPGASPGPGRNGARRRPRSPGRKKPRAAAKPSADVGAAPSTSGGVTGTGRPRRRRRAAGGPPAPESQ